MAIKHKAVKASGDAGLASEWNDDHEITGDVDFNQYEAVNLVFEGLAAPPAGPIMGQTYFDTVLLQWRVWDGTTWLSCAGVDVSLYIRHNGSVAFTGNQSMGTHKITDVVNPTAAQDAATKNYVDMRTIRGQTSGFSLATGNAVSWSITGSWGTGPILICCVEISGNLKFNLGGYSQGIGGGYITIDAWNNSGTTYTFYGNYLVSSS